MFFAIVQKSPAVAFAYLGPGAGQVMLGMASRWEMTRLVDTRQMMLDALVQTIEGRYRDSVAFAVVYGSYVTGRMSPKSDVDVVFVGKDARAFELQRTFSFQGIGYDFFCMPIERVRRIVDEFQPLVSIFAQGRLLWADDSATKTYFAELQRAIRTAGQNSTPTKYGSEIETLLMKMKALVFDHQTASPPARQHIQGRLILLTGDLLARVNRTYFRSGIKRYLEEIEAFDLKPASVTAKLEALMRGLVPTEELALVVADLERFWAQVKRQSPHERATLESELSGFYEEAISTWNKIQHAAMSGDHRLTYLAAACLEDELTRLRAQGLSLTSMFEGCPTGAEQIAINAATNQRELVEILVQRKVPIVEFDDIGDVLAYIGGEDQPAATPSDQH